MLDLIIVGGGPGGLSAAIYAARYKLDTLLITKEIGGDLNKIHLIENYPGYGRISGFELAKKFEEHVKNYNVKIKQDEVVGIRKEKDKFVVNSRKEKFEAKKIILALGSEKRKLNLENEERFLGKGISYCYLCDAPFYKDKIVGIIGGSYSAVRAAVLLMGYAKKLYIICRKDKLRGDPIENDYVLKNKKVELIKNANVVKLNGDKFLESVKLDNGKEIKLDGLFIEIGSVPNTALIKEFGIKTDENGFIIVNENKETNIKGVFAVGDVTNTKIKQIIVAAADGAISATNVFYQIKEE